MGAVRRRRYLTFPQPRLREPVLCELYDRARAEEGAVADAIGCLTERGVQVEPGELNVIE